MNHTELWAKTAQGDTFHPVICHLLDTAAVCQRLLQLLPLATVQRLQRGLGCDESGLRTWVAFLAGAHDTGKVSPPFQFKDTPALEMAKKLAGGSLYDLWSTLPKMFHSLADTPHGVITACTLPSYLINRSLSPTLAEELAAIVGGHHGTIPNPELIGDTQKGSRRQKFVLGHDNASPQWRQWRLEILDILANYCVIRDVAPPTACDPAAAVLLAGITTLSDWLASNQKCFPPAGANPDLQDYISKLPAKVEETLKAAQWQEWQPHKQPLSFTELFKNSPRGLQDKIERLMPALKGKPSLLIIEAPTGEGKTEAALTVAHWHTSNGMPGVYIGMPTQATGNALYNRLRGYLNDWYSDQSINLQLVHSAAVLDENFSKDICRIGEIYGDSKSLSNVTANEWFVHRKRALLAPWGVGTVDQALVGILRTRHQFLRLLGLAGKTVVLDEVHAYDSYTSRLLEQLVHWCAVLDSPVVILSATLSCNQRQRLLNSYATGLGLQQPNLPEANYPRLTIYSNGEPSCAEFEVAKINQNRTIKICWIEESEIDVYIGLGATAIIRSTVRRCQKTAGLYPEAKVFHSRFTQEHRQRKEDYCQQKYGKPKHKNDPVRPPSVLIATQVIEQSLDVDFDVLVSDICPVDLLIQRIGRLWRHDRIYRSVQERVIYLIRPQIDENNLPHFGDDIEGKMGDKGYQQRVYDRHALLRTWYLLHAYPSFTLPQHTDTLIESVYNLAIDPAIKLTEIQQQDWNNSLEHYKSWQESLKHQAEQGVIPKLTADFQSYELTHRSIHETEVESGTRLIQDSITVIVDKGDGKVICDRIPVEDEIKQVLRQQIKISSPSLIYILKNLGLSVPKKWKNIPYLRETLLLQVPQKVGKYTLDYDERLGLQRIG